MSAQRAGQVPARLLDRVAVITVTAWAGGLWTICALVAPGLFALAADRRQAGDLAGAFFAYATWIGVGFAAVLTLCAVLARSGTRHRYWLIAWTAGPPVISELVLGPAMSAARAARAMGQFGALHVVSAVLFFVACIAAALLVFDLHRTHASRAESA